MHTVFALLCFVVVIHWLISPYPSGLLHWHCGNLTIAPVPAKHPWWIWINTSCEFIMNDCITTTKQSTTKPCAYFLGYTVMAGSLTAPTHNTYHFVVLAIAHTTGKFHLNIQTLHSRTYILHYCLPKAAICVLLCQYERYHCEINFLCVIAGGRCIHNLIGLDSGYR